MTDWRSLAAELVEALDGWHKAVFETGTGWVRPDETYLLDRARAALADEPVAAPAGPTDEELLATLNKATAEFPPRHPEAEALNAVEYALELELRKARAVLAAEADGPAVQSREPASVVGEPSDEELLELSQFHCVSYTLSDGTVVSPYVEDTDMRSEVLSFARAVLSRYGHQPAPPVEGEVAELVAWLHGRDGGIGRRAIYSRIADLLEQRHPTPVPVDELLAAYRSGAADAAHPTPVPVNERLPGPEDCDEEGFCWWFSTADPSAGTFGVAACWVLRKHEPEDDFRTHWLPATALPLPQGEVQP